MNISSVVCLVECISYLGTAWSSLKHSLLVFVLSIGKFVFSVPHSSLMMYTSVSTCVCYFLQSLTQRHV